MILFTMSWVYQPHIICIVDDDLVHSSDIYLRRTTREVGQWLPKAREALPISSLSYMYVTLVLFNTNKTKNMHAFIKS